jgi:hypothetical protein
MASVPAANLALQRCTLPPVLAVPPASRSVFSFEACNPTTQPVNDALQYMLRPCAIELGWRWQ